MELLAPVGNPDALKAAIAAGADAVYLGLGELNARIKSNSFDTDNLSFWVRYCHLFGVKVYVTINVMLYQSEIQRAYYLVDIVKKANADAIISSDIAVLDYSKKKYPDLHIHISTQSGVHNANGAEFYKQYGADRVVLSRECSLSQITQASRLIETEVFVHGALCVCFSGNCLLSSYIGGNSGNRGKCRQPCRQQYNAYDSHGEFIKRGYLLSAKDICLADKLSDLRLAGVSSLKIEGRLKSAEYVFAVTSYYRALLGGKKGDFNAVKTVYNRGGFCKAYLDGIDIIYPKVASHIGIPIGKVINVVNKKGFSFAKLNCVVQKGDGLKLLRDGEEVGGSDVTSVQQLTDGSIVPISSGVCSGDNVYLTKSVEYSKALSQIKLCLQVDFVLYLHSDLSAALTAVCKGSKVSVNSPLSISDGHLLTESEVFGQLSKTGGTNFEARSAKVIGQGYLPKSALNAMRNDALKLLEQKVVDSYSRLLSATQACSIPTAVAKLECNIYQISHSMQAEGLCGAFVYAPSVMDKQLIAEEIKKLSSLSKNVYIRYPLLLSAEEESTIIELAKRFCVGIYASNSGMVFLARKHGLSYIAGIELNLANSVACGYFADADAIIFSVESTDVPNIYHRFSYGRVPLMTLMHCPSRVCRGGDCSGCKHKGESLFYSDGKSSFLLKAVKGIRCYYTLYSDKTLRLSDNTNKQFIDLSTEEANTNFSGFNGGI